MVIQGTNLDALPISLLIPKKKNKKWTKQNKHLKT